ncbi:MULTISPECIES: DUF72 domain-containing protein [unclassified Anaeromyxobacter]|uniref:DUF72 domain-containing protein n=1 Tax=unclassified Anaeromyxobacter TaxID=2620896 RepID=UPI001F5856AA|nr:MULTISPECIES: DUF72 domain-containing protein [unclassified Anaeromyxobacter]
MRVRTGTSGWSYPAWKGRFYAPALPARGFLGHYATRLETVEVNATFYRMPVASTLALWRAQVPAGFTFALKASRLITHHKRIEGVGEEVSRFFRAAVELGPSLGPVLFQLPPTFERDVARLRDLLELVPPGARIAFEFRHESWQAEDVRRTLADAGAALCIADTDDATTPLEATASFGYLRLRRTTYGDAELAGWAERVLAQRWDEAFVFFKHEDAARGPEYALRMAALVAPAERYPTAHF